MALLDKSLQVGPWAKSQWVSGKKIPHRAANYSKVVYFA